MTAAVRQLRRVQWAVRATLLLGVAASVAANILHAKPHPIAQTIAAWPPLALLITVELVSRVPLHRRGLGVIRVFSTTVIAGIAAFVSYQHMVGVAARYGETGLAPYLLPISVDGLIIVASVSLAELAGRIRELERDSLGGDVTPPLLPESQIVDTVETERPETDGRSRPSSVSSDRDQRAEPVLSAELAELLPAARNARDELVNEGRTISRDSLAAILRREGYSIRNNRVSELVAILKAELPSPNGKRPKAPD